MIAAYLCQENHKVAIPLLLLFALSYGLMFGTLAAFCAIQEIFYAFIVTCILLLFLLCSCGNSCQFVLFFLSLSFFLFLSFSLICCPHSHHRRGADGVRAVLPRPRHRTPHGFGGGDGGEGMRREGEGTQGDVYDGNERMRRGEQRSA